MRKQNIKYFLFQERDNFSVKAKCLRKIWQHFSCLCFIQYLQHSLVFFWQYEHLFWVVHGNQELLDKVLVAILTGAVEPHILFLKTLNPTFNATLVISRHNSKWLTASLGILYSNAIQAATTVKFNSFENGFHHHFLLTEVLDNMIKANDPKHLHQPYSDYTM